MKKLLYVLVVIAFVLTGVGIVGGVAYLLYGRDFFSSPNEEADTGAATFSCSDGTVFSAFFEREEAVLTFSNGEVVRVGWTASASVSGKEGARYATPNSSLIFWHANDVAFVERGGTFPYGECQKTGF